MKRNLDGKHTVGLFVTSAEDKYENAILRGVFSAVHAIGGNLVCFTSGAVRSYHGFEAKRNILYDLVNHDVVDGLVISGALGHNISTDEMLALCNRYRPLPMVSIALPLKDIPGLRVDSLSGMRHAVDHLIDVHGKRNIVFIRGPRGQQEADERYESYLECLTEHGIKVNEKLILQGDYTRQSGAAVMHKLLKTMRGKFDAVAAANDSMSLGAMDMLFEAGLQVPEEVAFVGFDDTDDGRYQTPPLTTVRQSAYEQGIQAGRMVLALLDGEKLPTQLLAPAALVIRQSCGCGVIGSMQGAMIQPAITTDRNNLDQMSVRDVARAKIAEQSNLLSADMPENWIDQLLDALQSNIASPTSETFLHTLHDLLQGEPIVGNETVWYAVLSTLQDVAGDLTKENEGVSLSDETWVQLRLLVDEVNARQQAQRRIWSERQTTMLRELGETMLTTFDMDSLLDVISHELPRIGVQSCFLSLYMNPDEPAGMSNLILAYDLQQGRRDLPYGGLRFSSLNLIPNDINFCSAGGCLVVEALYSKSEQLGFVVMEMQPDMATISGTLRGLLSSALQGILLLQQRQQVEAELRRYQMTLEEMVASRTEELAESNARLRLEVQERERAEKTVLQLNAELEVRVEERTAQLQAAIDDLESFSYSVSHDLRAPLRSMAGFTRILLEDFSGKIPSEAISYLDRIRDSAVQMGLLIDDLLAFSRLGRYELRQEEVDMNAVVLDVFDSLAHEYKDRRVEIVIGVLPSARVDRSLLTQVYMNLIGNAIKYTRNRDEAKIEVGCQKKDGENIYYVKDNGAGFNMAYSDKLFNVFHRLHRQDEFEGTGVGLAIVKRVIDRHNGRIWADAEEGKGASFFFTMGAIKSTS